jgi:prepilin-type N-terminal cleavage/methylation domain-containing protein
MFNEIKSLNEAIHSISIGGLKTMLELFGKKEQGFTLMELLIAVGIIAVLAGVGVPLYLQLQSGAKAAEANIHLDSIRTCQESYKMVNNSYLTCDAAPRAANAVDQDPFGWAATAGFTSIGFQPNASVRFAYAVKAGGVDGNTASTEYAVGAVGDTNGDGTNYILYVATESAGPHVVTDDAPDGPDTAAVAALVTVTDFGTVTTGMTTD